MTRIGIVSSFALVTIATACGGDATSPESLIDTPRILAIAAEPPVVDIDGETDLTALVASGDGTLEGLSLSWRACDPWQPFISPEASCGPESSLPILNARFSTSEVIKRFPPPNDVLDTPPSSDSAEKCDAAYPSVDAFVVLEVTVAGQTLVASKRIRVALQERTAPRTNPRLEAMLFDGEVFSDSAPSFEAGTPHLVSIQLDAETVDAACDEDEPEKPALERFNVNVYATAGNFDPSSLNVELGLDGSEAIDETTWTIESADSSVELWLVITDREGGIGWSQFSLDSQ